MLGGDDAIGRLPDGSGYLRLYGGAVRCLENWCDRDDESEGNSSVLKEILVHQRLFVH